MGRVKIYHPTLTEEERIHRTEQIKQALVVFCKEVDKCEREHALSDRSTAM